MNDEIADQDILALIADANSYGMDLKADGQLVRDAFAEHGKELTLEEAIGLWSDFSDSWCAYWIDPSGGMRSRIYSTVMSFVEMRKRRPAKSKTYDDFNWANRIKCL